MGRKVGTKVTYTPQQTGRYRSQWLRSQKAQRLSIEAVSDTKWQVASGRSPAGFWTVERGESRANASSCMRGGVWTPIPSDAGSSGDVWFYQMFYEGGYLFTKDEWPVGVYTSNGGVTYPPVEWPPSFSGGWTPGTQIEFPFSEISSLGSIDSSTTIYFRSPSNVLTYITQLHSTDYLGPPLYLESNRLEYSDFRFEFFRNGEPYTPAPPPPPNNCPAGVRPPFRGFRCDCPDYTRTQPATGKHLSEMSSRDWSSSSAGSGNVAGVQQPCKHIMAVMFDQGINVDARPGDHLEMEDWKKFVRDKAASRQRSREFERKLARQRKARERKAARDRYRKTLRERNRALQRIYTDQERKEIKAANTRFYNDKRAEHKARRAAITAQRKQAKLQREQAIQNQLDRQFAISDAYSEKSGTDQFLDDMGRRLGNVGSYLATGRIKDHKSGD